MDLMRRTAAGEPRRAVRGRSRSTSTRTPRVPPARTHRARLALIAGDQMAQLRAYAEGANASRAAAVAVLCCCASGTCRGGIEDSPLVGAIRCTSTCGARRPATNALWTRARTCRRRCSRCWRATARAGTRRCKGRAASDGAAGRRRRSTLRKLAADAEGNGRHAMLNHGRPPSPQAARARDVGRSPAARLRPGSNNFAVSGAVGQRRSRHRRQRRAPGPARSTRFRARLRYPDPRAPAAASTCRASPCPACRWWWSAATATSPGASPTATSIRTTGRNSANARRRERRTTHACA